VRTGLTLTSIGWRTFVLLRRKWKSFITQSRKTTGEKALVEGVFMGIIDRRRHYILVVDTETANTLSNDNGKLDMSNVLVYDCGWAVVDTKGHIYETASFVNKDIFIHEKELMKSAYYADKIPRYKKDLEDGSRIMATTYEIREAMLETIKRYEIKEVCAHNARFDYNALNSTERWVTKSKYRYWFPYGQIEMWDTMKMAEDVVCKMPTYKTFCESQGYTLKNGKPRKTAEILYRFISGDWEFQESHTGLEDVLIEAQILFYCYRQHKPMRKALFENKPDNFPPTTFQKTLNASIKETPVLKGRLNND
jgi:hypothetical protein